MRLFSFMFSSIWDCGALALTRVFFSFLDVGMGVGVVVDANLDTYDNSSMEAESKELQAQREKKKGATKTKFKALEKKLGDNEHLVRFLVSCFLFRVHRVTGFLFGPL